MRRFRRRIEKNSAMSCGVRRTNSSNFAAEPLLLSVYRFLMTVPDELVCPAPAYRAPPGAARTRNRTASSVLNQRREDLALSQRVTRGVRQGRARWPGMSQPPRGGVHSMGGVGWLPQCGLHGARAVRAAGCCRGSVGTMLPDSVRRLRRRSTRHSVRGQRGSRARAGHRSDVLRHVCARRGAAAGLA